MRLNFLLHEPGKRAALPECPHIACADGYAWHPDPKRRLCFCGVTTAPAEAVARILDPKAEPIERVWSLRTLLEPNPDVLFALWPYCCGNCGISHAADRGNWRRAAQALQPGALDALRQASPSLRMLLDLDVPGHKADRRQVPGLPVRGSPEATEAAQVEWARALLARATTPRTPRGCRPRRSVSTAA
jgi:hypothetical protein